MTNTLLTGLTMRIDSIQEVEIKIYKTDHEHTQATIPSSQTSDHLPIEDSSNTTQTLLITIHIYLTTSVIMFQGQAFQFWAEREFSILKELTDIAVSKHLKVADQQLTQHETNNHQGTFLQQASRNSVKLISYQVLRKT